MNPHIKNLILTFLVYGALFGIASWLFSISPGGPCVPSGGALFMIYVAPVVTGVFLLGSLIMVISKRYDYLLSLFVSIIIIIVAVSQIIQN